MSTFTKQFLLIFFACSFHLAPTIAQTSTAGVCLTPNHERGNCIALEQCSDLLNLLKNKNLTQEDRTFLAKSQCGYTTFVWVCCPQRLSSSTEASHQVPETSTAVPEAFPSPPEAFPSPPEAFPSPPEAFPSPPRASSPITEASPPVNSLPKYPDCGKEYINDRIYGGETTSIAEFPWMAQLQYTKSLNLKGIHCAGSLVHKRFVLTAAHCAVGSSIPSTWILSNVRLGEWDTTSNPDCDDTDCAPVYQDIAIEKIMPHPKYIPELPSQHHDIALLKLSTEAVLSEFVSIICLPIDNSLRHNGFEGQHMDIAGWGKTEMSSSSSIKLKADLTVWNLNECHEAFMRHNISVSSEQMCAGGRRGIDGCRGDSGGPLMFRETSTKRMIWYLTGIISLGLSPCGLDGWPGIYLRSGAYIDWIDGTITSET